MYVSKQYHAQLLNIEVTLIENDLVFGDGEKFIKCTKNHDLWGVVVTEKEFKSVDCVTCKSTYCVACTLEHNPSKINCKDYFNSIQGSDHHE